MIISKTFHTSEGYSNTLIYSPQLTIIIITSYICLVFYRSQCAPHESSLEPNLDVLCLKSQKTEVHK